MGFGGPCLPRDTRAFSKLCNSLGIPAPLSEASGHLNRIIETEVKDQVMQRVGASPLTPKRVLICGITYKPDSWLLEDSHSFKIAEAIRSIPDIIVDIFDPLSQDIAHFSSVWREYKNCYGCMSSDIHELLDKGPNIIVSTRLMGYSEYDSILAYTSSSSSESDKIRPILIDLACHSVTEARAPISNNYSACFQERYSAPPNLAKEIYQWFHAQLGVDPRSAHEQADEFFKENLLNKDNDQYTNLHQQVYAKFDSDQEFTRLYQELIKNVVDAYRLSSGRLVVQAFPSLRFQFPNNLSVFEFHQDSFYSHPHEEINTFYAVTDCIESSGLWLQQQYQGPFNEFSSYQPLNLRSGSYARLNTATMWHGDVPNLSNNTRISLDFRILTTDAFLNDKKTLSGKRNIAIGSYYRYYDTFQGAFV